MAQPITAGGIDPRKRITPENFSVAPHLLGLPLATPTRRLAAILLDLCLVAVLANLGGKVLFALLMGTAFFWFAGRKLNKGGTLFSRTARAAMRGVGALMLAIAAMALWSSAKGRVGSVVGDDDDAPAAPQVASVAGKPGKSSSPTAALRLGAQLLAVSNAPDSAHAATAARNAVREMRSLGMTDAHIRQMLSETSVEDDTKPYVAAALRAAMPPPSAEDSAAEREAAVPRDSLAALYVAAVHGGDPEHAEALRPKLASVLARDSLDELAERVSGLEDEKRSLTEKVKEEESKGILATLLGMFNDLGIGFGWTGLYFTAFTALWKGQTPGKKLFGIRVLRLDGVPMTLWASFERFGGYAAGLFTGLMGYAQVYWDRNRQAIQDKISETVVIRETGQIPVAPPAPAWPARPGPQAGAPYPPSPSYPPPYPPAEPGQPFPRG